MTSCPSSPLAAIPLRCLRVCPTIPKAASFLSFKRIRAGFPSTPALRSFESLCCPASQGKLRLALNYLSFAWSGLVIGSWRLRGRKFDAIFVFQISPITAALPAVLQRRLKKAPLLLWVLDLWPDTLAAVGVIKSEEGADLAGLPREPIFIERCDRILIQSRAFGANIERYAGDRERIRYFPGWAEPTFQGQPRECHSSSRARGLPAHIQHPVCRQHRGRSGFSRHPGCSRKHARAR